MGPVPEEQDARLREIALWNFVNGEAIKDVRPWVITNEGDIWFTRNQKPTPCMLSDKNAALEAWVTRRQSHCVRSKAIPVRKSRC